MLTPLEYPIFYPVLGGRDLGFVRLAGAGLGNGFYSYFHAVVLAKQFGGQIIAPAWRSIKPGRLLSGKGGERSYWNLFRSHPSEITGVRKAALLSLRPSATFDANSSNLTPIYNGVNRIITRTFTFCGLHSHRALVRERLLAVACDQPPHNFAWGGGGYIAAHVRLGDFAAPSTPTELASGKANLRIPIEWYLDVFRQMRARYPKLPLRILSDGSDAELAPLLSTGATVWRTGSDLGDLYALAGASVLIGSNSTYSRWAAFLGDMPSLWLRTAIPAEQPTSAQTPIAYASLEGKIETAL